MKKQSTQQWFRKKPIPTPCNSVKEMIRNYEESIILPPFKFRDKLPTIIEGKEPPIPAPRTKKQGLKKPVPLPRTIIKETDKALKGYTTSYEISITKQ